MKIKHIFLDLDRTLWDFDANSKLELRNIWNHYQLHQKGIALPDQFIAVYEQINNNCWKLYRENKLTKEILRVKRFNDTLIYFGIEDNELAKKIALTYTTNSPKRTILVEGALEILDYLKPKYELHIITNGFLEVQHLKLKKCGLTPYFKTIITSDEVGVMKPNKKVFDFALNQTSANSEESVYIGDSYKIDIEGAVNAGWNAIYYNPKQTTCELPILGNVHQLIDIKNCL